MVFLRTVCKEIKTWGFRSSSGLTESGVKQMMKDKGKGLIPFKRSALMSHYL
jgi:hypothetical protein